MRWKEGIPPQSGLLGISISLLVFLMRLVQLLTALMIVTLTVMVPLLAVELGFPDHGFFVWIKYALILPFATHNWYYGHGLMLKFNAFVRWLSEDAGRAARKHWNRPIDDQR